VAAAAALAAAAVGGRFADEDVTDAVTAAAQLPAASRSTLPGGGER